MLAAAALSAALILAVPGSAATFTSSDGIFSINLPTDNWKQISDPMKWIALSDGTNLITVEHFANGEALPDIAVADSHYVNVYQAVFSTQNEVFIVTGSVVNPAEISNICNAIISSKVLRYDTKHAVSKQASAGSSSYTSVVPMDATYYVIANELNVRAGTSTSEKSIGVLTYGRSVHVTGKAQQNGADTGWYQIDYNGSKGYVYSEFLSASAPAASAPAASAPAPASSSSSGSSSSESQKSSNVVYTGNVKAIYDTAGNAITIYEATDQYWYDSNGKQYNWVTENEVNDNAGNKYSFNRPITSDSGLSPTGEVVTAYWLIGNPETLTGYDNGFYYSTSWIAYTFNGSVWVGADGSTLYTDPDALERASEASLENNNMVQCEYCGEWLEAGNIYRNHMCAQKRAALGIADDYIDDTADGYIDDIHDAGSYIDDTNGSGSYVDDTNSSGGYVDDTSSSGSYVDDTIGYVDDVNDVDAYIDDTNDGYVYD